MDFRFQGLSRDELTEIHRATVWILEQTGVAFRDEEARRVFRDHGAQVDGEVVRIPEALLDRALAEAPEKFVMTGRDPAKQVTIGGGELVLLPGYGSPFIIDAQGKRPALLEDYRNFCKLVQTSPHLNMNGNIMCEPSDVPSAKSHLHQVAASLILCDKPTLGSSISRRAARDSYALAALAWGGEAAIGDKNVILAIISSLSPLQYSEEMAGALVEYARNNQPVMVGGLLMAGSTSPVRLAGTITLQNAEFLAGIVLAQLISPGLGCIYGGTTGITDMRSGGLSIGAAEMHLMQNLQAQVARFYHLPCRGSGGISDAFLVDYQAGAESALALLTTIAAGSNFILHAAGILGAYLAMSFEKFLADEEVLGMIRRIMTPVSFTEETIDLATIERIGIGGEYLTDATTFKNCRTEYYQGHLMQRGYYSTWQAGGSKSLEELARDKLPQRLEAYQKPEIDPAVEQAIQAYIDRS